MMQPFLSSKTPSAWSRRSVLRAAGGAAVAAAASGLPAIARAAPPLIRYATGGGIGPNEIETVIYLPWMQKNVLKHYGKEYDLKVTFTRGTPEAASLIAAGQCDMGTLSFAIFAASVLKDVVPGGMSIVADIFQDARPGYTSNTYFVLDDSPIRKVTDLKGKTIGINAFGSAVDLVLRVVLKKNGLNPKSDVQIVEVPFPSMGAAIREKRIDCGVLILPFMAAEEKKGGLRGIFTDADAFGPFSVIFQVATNSFLKQHSAVVKAYLDDYVRGLHWLYDPANRKKAIEITAELVKSPPETVGSYFLTSHDYYRDRNACLAPALLQGPVDAMVKEGFLASKVDMGKYLNTSYLPHACPAG
jgi:NitT/TauT family transport system substrate-binding protein